MNSRIFELAEVALEETHRVMGSTCLPEAFDDYYTEVFAKLIVRECCDWIDGSPTSESGCQLLLTKSFIIANLKGHFGI